MVTAQERARRRIALLAAKAASTSGPESDALLSKAEELRIKHDIEGEVEYDPEQVEVRRYVWEKELGPAACDFAAVLASALPNVALVTGTLSNGSSLLLVHGQRNPLRTYTDLLDRLLSQACERLLAHARSGDLDPTSVKQHSQFLRAYAEVVSARIAAVRAEASPSPRALVLVTTEVQRLHSHIQQRYEDLGTSVVQPAVRSGVGWNLGVRSGMGATIDPPSLPN